MIDLQEKKNKRIALATTIGIHAALLLIFLFAVAWRAPDPPLPEYGIELNFGLDEQGSGAVQPQQPVGTPVEQLDEQTEVESTEPEVEPTTPQQATPVESKPIEQPVTSSQESPVTVKEEKKPEPKPAEKPKEQPQEKPVETKPKENPATVYKPDAKTGDKTQTKTGETGSQGDDTNKTGDKGDPKGSLDAKALYGKQGGGDGGSSLDLAGWNWDVIPKPDVPNNESGRVVFEIKVDDNGEIISIRTLERSVSLEAEKACRKEIEKLTFSKTGANVPAISTGKITFVIRSN